MFNCDQPRPLPMKDTTKKARRLGPCSITHVHCRCTRDRGGIRQSCYLYTVLNVHSVICCSDTQWLHNVVEGSAVQACALTRRKSNVRTYQVSTPRSPPSPGSNAPLLVTADYCNTVLLSSADTATCRERTGGHPQVRVTIRVA